MKKKPHRASLPARRWVWYAGAAALLLLAAAALGARQLLPQLVERKDDIEAAINRVSPHPVRLGRLTAYWDGLRPGLHVEGVDVLAADRRAPALRLREVRVSLAWLPLVRGRFEIHSLEVTGASLVLERLADGRFRLAGFDPVQPAAEGQGEAFLEWLFRQNRLAIFDGELTWRDAHEPGRPLRFTRVNLALHNQGERHRLDASAAFPPALCGECSLTVDVTGNPFAAPDWRGEIRVRAGALDVAALPRIARERLPEKLAGRFDLRLHTQWDGGRPRRVDGQASVRALRLPLPGLSVPLALRELSGDVVWNALDDGWRLDLRQLALGFTQPAWAADTLKLEYRAGVKALEAGHVNLHDLTALADSLRGEHELLRRWAELRPEGALNRFRLRLAGDWASPREFSLATELDGFGVRPRAPAAGVRGLSGRLQAGIAGGEFFSESEDVSLTLPEVFRKPLLARQVRGRIAWEKRGDDWWIEGSDLRLAASGGQAGGDFSLQWPNDPARSPVLRVTADFRNLDGADAARYYPAKHLSRETLAWMERAFVGGRVVKGRLLYDGPTRAFPFSAGDGRFEIRAQVRDGTYDYAPGWVPVRQAEVDVAIDRDRVRVTGQGRIGELAARNVTVETRRGPSGREEVHVRGEAVGPVHEALAVLREVRPGAAGAGWIGYFPAGLQGGGEGALTLEVAVPLDDAPVRVAGEYRFKRATLREPESGAGVEALDGHVAFGDAGLREARLRGKFLGGEAALTANTRDGLLQLQAQGRIGPEGLAAVLGPRLAPHVDGRAAWSATWAGHKTGGALALEVGLRELRSRLPAPLHFPERPPVERLTVRTEAASADSHVLAVSAGPQIGGRLLFQRQGGAWQFAGGRIHFSDVQGRTSAAGGRVPGAAEERAPPRGRGLHLSAQLDTLDLDRWFPLLSREGTRPPPSWLARVSAEVRALELLDRPFGRLSVDLAQDKNGWAGTVAGANAAGRLRYARRGAGPQIDLDLATLTLPPAPTGTPAKEDIDPRKLPGLAIRSKAFQWHDMPLGELDFAAAPVAGGWRVARLNLSRPETRLAASGDWKYANNAHRSEFDLRLTSSDIGKTLAALGLPDQMSGGELDVAARLAWPASPAQLRLALLSGSAEITAEKGRFLQLKQGAGRFFGILDLSAIGRYLTLDFSPIFGQGFVYDRIHSQVTLERGNAYTDDLSLRGPSAKINVRGRIGLAAEDFDLAMEVQPQLSDSLTLGSWAIFGPQVAATVLALQKIFKKEITETTRVSYVVKGPWDNPTVTRTLKEGSANGTKPKG